MAPENKGAGAGGVGAEEASLVKGKDAETAEGKSKPSSAGVPFWCSCRVMLAYVGFLGFINLYALKINISVAMICMVNHTALHEMAAEDHVMNASFNEHGLSKYANPGDNHSVLDVGEIGDGLDYNEPQCGAHKNKTVKDGDFVWDKKTQGLLLGAFFWGYLVTQIPGGWLAERFGGKLVFGISMGLCSLITLFIPVGSNVSPWLLMVLRILQGMCEGVVYPAGHTLWARWAPPAERSKLIGLTYAGAQLGNVLTLPVAALLCDYGFAGGWPSIFYVGGMYGLVWFVLWMALVFDSPEVHPRITAVEREYIESSIGISSAMAHKHHKVPWVKIFTSKPCWAIIIGHFAANWGLYTLMTNMPTYMKEVLKFDIKANGGLSALPYLACWLVITAGGIIADKLVAKGWKTVTVRKTMYSVGLLVPSVLLIATGYVPCTHAYWAVGLMTIAVGISGLHYPGVLVNHVDIAPPFAGILFALSNMAGTIPGFLSPALIAVITVDQTQEQWQIVFYKTALVYVFGVIVFCIFADGELQDWIKPYMYEKNTTPGDEKEKLPLAAGGENDVHVDGGTTEASAV